jgi:hypothetical protein
MASRPLLRSLLGSALALSALVAPTVARGDDRPTFADRFTKDVVDVDRSFAIMLDPLAIATGVYGGDVDVVIGKHFAASVEGDIYNVTGTTALAFGAGMIFYPGVAFHGLYLEPRLVFARPLGEGLVKVDWSSDALGVGATAGWQWTWDYGFSLRLGGGGIYYVGGPSPTPNAVALGGPQIVVDGSIGWAF